MTSSAASSSQTIPGYVRDYLVVVANNRGLVPVDFQQDVIGYLKQAGYLNLFVQDQLLCLQRPAADFHEWHTVNRILVHF